MTIYVPALKQIGVGNCLSPDLNVGGTTNITDQNNLTNQISDFIQGIRIQSEVKMPPQSQLNNQLNPNQSRTGQDADCGTPQPGTSRISPHIQEARDKAEKIILDAEQHKAAINAPSGRNFVHSALDGIQDPVHPDIVLAPDIQLNEVTYPALLQSHLAGVVDSNKVIEDDDFFHVSCHVDANLKSRIQRGDFVDLEKLLPRNRRPGGAENRIELVFRDGKSFFVPAATDGKISNIRRWEQAFRVYAAIYSEANPSQAAEIWQYVYVINSAAATYVWDNVANYDYTFRQLMSCNPNRSWAKIYNQMWNLAMKDYIPRSNYGSSSAFQRGIDNGNYTGNSGRKARKPKYCWAYNRGNCKDGAKCKFVHRCSYCDANEHANHTCPKKSK